MINSQNYSELFFMLIMFGVGLGAAILIVVSYMVSVHPTDEKDKLKEFLKMIGSVLELLILPILMALMISTIKRINNI